MRTVAYFNGKAAGQIGVEKCVHLGEKKGEIKVACGSGRSKFQAAFECQIHKRCLPNYRPVGAAKKLWILREEATVYHLCDACPDRQTS